MGYLVESKWKGNVILEYLFEFHNQLLSDLEILSSKFIKENLTKN